MIDIDDDGFDDFISYIDFMLSSINQSTGSIHLLDLI